MSEVKQVKVDNWGIYFLQRLKHFFNRTDYCDLTLQFQDNAQLKVHRLVLNACTEYFELLERTCEMYEDCLVMPDDLQADVVVPIVNFMYTGHLEFRLDLLERLYQTSQILNMPVLTKLLESHRIAMKSVPLSYSAAKRFPKPSEPSKLVKSPISNKRSYSKAFDNNTQYREKKVYQPLKSIESDKVSVTYRPPSPIQVEHTVPNNKISLTDPRPTRYELPEELDQDNVFDNSFCNISYTCKPLMVHPETVKRYSPKRTGIFSEASSSKKMLSTLDVVECKRISKENNIFDDNISDNVNDDLDIFQPPYNNDTVKNTSHLFDQILDDSPKVTIETKDSKVASNLDHAKIISEVLKKYPHLVKSNKNIKLKVLSTPTKTKKLPPKSTYIEEKTSKLKTEEPDYTYETDVIDSQQAAKLIAMGAENTRGPWICLICGTPGKALHFTSYYKFRRHLVDVHKEKPVSNICEYCGLRSLKRNYLLHHLYSQHGVPPPPQYNFPKCNRCNYIALTEGLLVKHKMTHKDVKNFRCNVCSSQFITTKQLLQHIQATGHKYSAERKTNLQCIYCLKTFLRDGNLYAHLKTYHKKEAKRDGVIEDSDDEKTTVETSRMKIDNREDKYQSIKYEPSTSYDNEYEVDVQYQIQQGQDGDIQLTPTKQHTTVSTSQHKTITNMKQKILNPGFGAPKPAHKGKPPAKAQPESSPYLEEINIPLSPISNNHNEEEIVLIDNTEYIMRDNQLIPRKLKSGSNEYIISDVIEPASLQAVQPTTSTDYTNVHNSTLIEEATSRMLVKKATNINQPIQIVVSNEEEYKALMASNHPILFDNDANKTLTVLTAQHSGAMQPTSIDLNNTASNNMMIIQEDYPINVTEAIPTDNPNIVVVYSHPVDDQNKQYQILTTGGIGSQFVESSAIITQNYETVTTSTSVTNVHELAPQVDTMWQGNVQDINNQQISTELQNVIEDTQMKGIENVTNNSVNALPEIHLTRESETSIPQAVQVIHASNELNVVNSELVSHTAEQAILEQSQTIPTTEIDTDILAVGIVKQTESIIPNSMAINHEDECTSVSLANDVSQNVNIPVSMEHIIEAVNHSTTENHMVDIEEHVETTVEHTGIEEASKIAEVHTEMTEGPSEMTEGPTEMTEAPTEMTEDPTEMAEDTTEMTECPTERSEGPSEITEDHREVPDTHAKITEEQTEITEEQTDISEEQTEITKEHTEMVGKHVETVQITEFVSQDKIVSDGVVIETSTVEKSGNFNDDIPLPESQAYDDIVQMPHETKVQSPTYIKEADEKIQNLTSEWSEDEYDISEEPTTEANITNSEDIQEPKQLEESIGNIQREMQNHINSASTMSSTIEPTIDSETANRETLILLDTLTGEQSQQNADTATSLVAKQNNPQAQEKISSLLNDWEDNDSPEDNSADVPVAEEQSDDITTEKNHKIDKIKNLVSDWDEEDEETRTEQ